MPHRASACSVTSRSQAIKRAFIAEFFRLFRTCLLGLFDPASIYESRERRTWHDRSANTWVIRHGARVGSLHSTAALIIGLFAFFTPIVLSAQYDVPNPLDPLILEVMPAVDDAMSPTIRRGDFLLASSRLYSQREYRRRRGDIAEIAPPRRVQHAGRSCGSSPCRGTGSRSWMAPFTATGSASPSPI